MRKLKPITVTVYFPADMDVGEDRARWYLNHAIRGYWQGFAHDGDPIRQMSKCVVAIHRSIPSESGRLAFKNGETGE